MAGRSGPETWSAVAAVVLSLLLPVLNHLVAAVAAGEVQTALGAAPEDLRWMVDVYTLALAASLLGGGALGDIYGRKGLLLSGIVLFTLASTACGLAESIDQLLAARAAQGVGAGLVISSSLSVLGTAFNNGGLGVAVGLWAPLAILGLAGGPVLSGFSVDDFGADSIFFVNVPLGAVALLVSVLAIRGSKDVVGVRKVDLPGLVTGVAATTFLGYALLQGGFRGWRDERIVGSFFLAGLAFLLFLIFQAKRRSPLVPLRFFRSSTFTASNVVAVALLFAWFAATFYLSAFLQSVLDFSPFEAGLRLLPLVGAILLVSPIAGSIADRRGSRALLTVGCAIAAGGMAALLRITPESSYESMVLPALLVVGLGLSLVMAASAIGLLGSVARRYAGVASGVNNTARILGVLLGVALLGAVVTDAFKTNLLSNLVAAGVEEPAARSLVDTNPQGAELSAQLQLPEGTSAEVAAAAEGAARESFVDAAHTAFLITAGFLLLASLVSAIFVRSHVRDRSEPLERVTRVRPETKDAPPRSTAGEVLAAAAPGDGDETPIPVPPPSEAPVDVEEVIAPAAGPDEAAPEAPPEEEGLNALLFELPFKAGTGNLQQTIVEFVVGTLTFSQYFESDAGTTRVPSAASGATLQTASREVATLSGYLLLEQRFGRINAEARPELAATSLIGFARALGMWNLEGDEEATAQLVADMTEMLMKGIGTASSEKVA